MVNTSIEQTCEAGSPRDRFQTLANAFRGGYNAAVALQDGDIFPGAMGAADASGFGRKSVAWEVYLSGYILGLSKRFPNGIICHKDNNRITFSKPNPVEKI